MLDLHIDTGPLGKMLFTMTLCMIFSGIVVGLLTRPLTTFISRPLTYLAVPFGAFLYFKYILPLMN